MNKNKILNYAIGPVAAALLSLISLPLITWFYPIEDIGKISMLQVVASFAVLLFSLGLDQAYTREYNGSSNKAKLFKHTFLPGCFLIFTVGLAIYTFDRFNLSIWLYEQESVYLSLASLACIIIAFCSRFLSLILRMQERALAYSMSQLFPKLFFLVFILLSVWFDFNGEFYNLITAHLLSLLTVVALFTWNTRKELFLSCRSKIVWSEFKPLFHFGIPLMMGGVAAWGLKVIDKFFLRSLSTFSELGVYSVALSIAGVATIFSGIFNTIWAPYIYKLQNEKRIDGQYIDRVSEYVLAAVYFVIVISGLFSWVIPYFLPQEYNKIKYLVPICMFVPLIYTLSEVTAIGIAITRNTKYSMYASIIALLVNVAGNYLLIPVMGALGAAISTTCAFLFYYILRNEFARFVWRSSPRLKAYFVTIFLLCSLIFNVIYIQKLSHVMVFWVLLLILGVIIFKNTFVYLLGYVRN